MEPQYTSDAGQVAQFAQTLKEQSKAQEYLQAISDAQTVRLQATDQKAAIAANVGTLKAAKTNMTSLFKAAVTAVFPEAGLTMSVVSALKNLPAGHPAYQVWQKTAPQVNQVDVQIANSASLYKAQSTVEQKAQETQNQLTDAYNQYRQSASTPLPNPPSPVSALAQSKPITSTQDDVNFMADIIGMEYISPRVQKFIFERFHFDDVEPTPPAAVATMTNDATSEDDEPIAASVPVQALQSTIVAANNAPVLTSAGTVVSASSGAPTTADASSTSVDPSVTSATAAPVSAASPVSAAVPVADPSMPLKLAGTLAVVAGIAYMVFGD